MTARPRRRRLDGLPGVPRTGLLAAALLLGAASPQGGQGSAGGGGQPPPADPPGVVRMSAEQQRTVGLGTTRAERRPITEPVRVPGTVAFDEAHLAILRPLAPSRILRLLARPGDPVQAGQVLAELDVPSLVSAEQDLAAARAAVREAEAGVAVARSALRRGELLARDGSLARAEAEHRRLLLAQADSAAEAARARVNSLQAQVARLNPRPGAGGMSGAATIVSPIAGTVVSVGAAQGELVDTAAAFTVADLGVVAVLAQVPEASAALVAVGDPAAVRLPTGSDRAWEGKVVSLGAALDPQARTLPARIQIANRDGALRSGMAVDVVVTSDRRRSDVVIPSAAVQMVGDKRVAFVPLGGDRYQGHELRLGVERQDWVEVRDGLRAGDEVVVQGAFELKALLQKAMLDGSG